MQITFESILPFILAVLLIWIIPMLLSKYGLTTGDLMKMLLSRFRKQDHDLAAERFQSGRGTSRVPHQKNSGIPELMEFVSALMTFARQNKVMVVYPGTVSFGGKTASLVAFVVTRSEIIGINCFGYSGKVYLEDGKWIQDMNGVRTEIDDPCRLSIAQKAIVSPMLKDAGLSSVPFRVVSVFTSRSLSLCNIPNRDVYTSKTLITELKCCVAEENSVISPEETAKKINSYVVKIKSKKKK